MNVIPAGVAYYPEFFNWFHQAMEACFEEYLGVSYAQMIETIGFPAVQTSAEFRTPLPVGATIDIEVRIERLGRSSIEWRFDIWREEYHLGSWSRENSVYLCHRRSLSICVYTCTVFVDSQTSKR